MSKEKAIQSIKYIMQHSPNNDRWNNIWLDERISKEEFQEMNDSLFESGFLVELQIGNKDIPSNVDILMHNALEQGLQNPIWGEVLTEIKTHRENHIAAPKVSRPAQSKLTEDNVPKIKNRPIAEWFVPIPDYIDQKEAMMAKEADERRLKNKEALKKLRQESKNKQVLEDPNIKVAVEQAKNLQDIVTRVSNIENIPQGSTGFKKRKQSKIAKSLSR